LLSVDVVYTSVGWSNPNAQRFSSRDRFTSTSTISFSLAR
jgi:hypothetical protein